MRLGRSLTRHQVQQDVECACERECPGVHGMFAAVTVGSLLVHTTGETTYDHVWVCRGTSCLFTPTSKWASIA